MKLITKIGIIVCLFCVVHATSVFAGPGPVYFAAGFGNLPGALPGSDGFLEIDVDLGAPVAGLSAADFLIASSNNGEAHADVIGFGAPGIVRLYWKINSFTFSYFENFVNNPATYRVENVNAIAGPAIGVRTLGGMLGGIPAAPGVLNGGSWMSSPGITWLDQWHQYILTPFSGHYLFPQKLNLTTDSKTKDDFGGMALEAQQSGQYGTNNSTSIYWGVRGHISADLTDSLNFAQVYPLALQFATPQTRLDILAGAESGSDLLTRAGRAVLCADGSTRIPTQLFFDLTGGANRIRPYPVFTLDVKAAANWADTTLADTVKKPYLEINPTLSYDIPVGSKFMLQTWGKLIAKIFAGSSSWQKIDYRYQVSFGYIVNKDYQIMLKFEQGNGEISYAFDKRLLIGFAMDALNLSLPN